MSQKYFRRINMSGFTLVELIVVIAILVILGTIAFVQLGNFAGSARDSARVSDMTSIIQGLELTFVKSGSYPVPDASNKGVITITASGTPIGYQGYAGSNVLSSIKMSDSKDPLDKKYYTYVTNANYSKYQILGLMEDSSTLGMNDTFGITPVYAGYETRIPTTKGSTLGVLLGNTGSSLNEPVQELYESNSFTGVDLLNQVFTGSSSFSIAGESSNSSSSSISFLPESCNTWIKNYPSLLGKDGTYRIKPSKTSSTMSVYCDMTTDGGGWTQVFWINNGTTINFADVKTSFLAKENLNSTGIFIGNKITQNLPSFGEIALDYTLDTNNQKINPNYYTISTLGYDWPGYSSLKYIFSLVVDSTGTTYPDLAAGDIRYWNSGTVKTWVRPSDINYICNTDGGYNNSLQMGMRKGTSTIMGFVACGNIGGVFSVRGNPVSFRAGDDVTGAITPTTYAAQRMRGWIR